jgi:3-methyladenine DNA glycosylase AlkD
MSVNQIKSLIRRKADKRKARILQRFFKTGKGQYGDGDIFVGVTVPEIRKIAKFFQETLLLELKKLLKSEIHEDRLAVLEILVFQFEKAVKNCDQKMQKEIFDFYLKNRSRINNWDLVDLSAPYIVGPYLLNCANGKFLPEKSAKKYKNILYKLAKSKNVWDKRISIISTFYFIKNKKFSDSLKISKILLNDEHDLIQKAVGWMLREIGKRDEKALKVFLKDNYRKMPRTMLRYSIEKFPDDIRHKYLSGEIC